MTKVFRGFILNWRDGFIDSRDCAEFSHFVDRHVMSFLEVRSGQIENSRRGEVNIQFLWCCGGECY
jgi:hypothetical protein